MKSKRDPTSIIRWVFTTPWYDQWRVLVLFRLAMCARVRVLPKLAVCALVWAPMHTEFATHSLAAACSSTGALCVCLCVCVCVCVCCR